MPRPPRTARHRSRTPGSPSGARRRRAPAAAPGATAEGRDAYPIRGRRRSGRCLDPLWSSWFLPTSTRAPPGTDASQAGSTEPHDSVRRMILVVDHYDSFTYNLVQLIEGLGRRTQVVKSDERSTDQLLAMHPDAVVLSPGPGHPRAAGVFIELLASLPEDVPVLGVCL